VTHRPGEHGEDSDEQDGDADEDAHKQMKVWGDPLLQK
jgi:hypothetical protein